MDLDNSVIRDELASDEKFNSVRPKNFEDFIGQTDTLKNLIIFAESARKRKTAMDHVLFYGQPGLGKTTLAQIIDQEILQHY